MAVADRLLPPGPRPREVWLTFGLAVLLHGLLVAVVIWMPRLQFGQYITVPVSYTVNLVDAPPGGHGGGGASPPPPAVQAPALAVEEPAAPRVEGVRADVPPEAAGRPLRPARPGAHPPGSRYSSPGP